MSEGDVLERLAELAGIEPYYLDSWGSRHELSGDTRLALLRAMGFAVATEGDRAQSLAALDMAPWRRMVEDVVIVNGGDRTQTDTQINHLGAAANQWLAWTVIEEQGQVRRGVVRLQELDRKSVV